MGGLSNQPPKRVYPQKTKQQHPSKRTSPEVEIPCQDQRQVACEPPRAALGRSGHGPAQTVSNGAMGLSQPNWALVYVAVYIIHIYHTYQYGYYILICIGVSCIYIYIMLSLSPRHSQTDGHILLRRWDGSSRFPSSPLAPRSYAQPAAREA